MPAEKMDGLSLNPQEELLSLLKQHAPEVFTEGRIDPDKLAATLGQAVSTDKERYGLNWAGKSDCFRHIQEPTTATLKPCRAESVNFDTTENLFIEGDNLNVLKVLQKSYYGRVKMIYIDPPYNTGSDSFIYPDKFSETQDEYLKRIGDKDAEGNLIRDGFWRKNSKDAGHFHSNWLCMMYPRLFLARNLLRADGVIFVSIDDNEVHNLRMIMNEVFGEDAFVADISVVNNMKGRNDKQYIASTHEHLFIYAKPEFQSFGLQLTDDQISEYDEVAENGEAFQWRDLRKRGSADSRKERPNMFFPLYINPKSGSVRLNVDKEHKIKVFPMKSNGEEGRWRWGKERVTDNIKLLKAFQVSKNDRWNISYPVFLKNEGGMRVAKPKSTWIGSQFSTDSATKLLRALIPEIDAKAYTPKAIGLMKTIIQQSMDEDDICLDFFAGSCTIAHCIMQMNYEEGTNRKYICVQLPEPCDNQSDTQKGGFSSVADIGKERIRRAAKKIADENAGKLDFDGGTLDLGFKVFKLDESNFKPWRGLFKDAAELEKELTLFVNNIRDGAGSEDILYELILKAGLDVNVSVEPVKKHGKTYYRLDGGRLIVCLEEKITQGLVDAILAEKPQQFITLDRGFAGNDQLKTNTALQLEAEKIEFKVI